MHRLRTCAARLRPLTASQAAAQTAGQPRTNMAAAATTGGTRTFQPIRCYTAPVASEPFLNGTSSNYVEEMYFAWMEDPKSVHKVRECGVAWRTAVLPPDVIMDCRDGSSSHPRIVRQCMSSQE